MPQKDDVKNQPLDTAGAKMTFSEWVIYEFIPRHGRSALTVAIAVLALVAGLIYFSRTQGAQEVTANRDLGPAYIYFGEGKLDSAQAFLTQFVQTSRPKLVHSKAYLLLGETFYQKGDYDQAIEAFSKVNLDTRKFSLITSGALHGIASSHMQKEEYTQAITHLEEFIRLYMRRTGNPVERSAGREPSDLSPAVPNALWKLTLNYQEVNQPGKVKETAEKLVKIYPDTREAHEAIRLLATF